MSSSEENVKKFFSNEINNCSKNLIRINMNELIKNFYVEEENIISFIGVFNQYINENKSWFDEQNNYFLSWKLTNLSPILKGKNFQQFLKETNCFYRNDELIVFEEHDLFFLSIKKEDSNILIETYYLIKNVTIENIEKDLKIITEKTNSQPELFFHETSDSFDTNINSILVFLLIKKYNYIFTKQDSETRKIISEIQELFFEVYSENNRGKLLAVIALITMIVEENLIKMYKKAENKRPNEGYNINLLNNCIAKNEIVELRLSSGNDYQLLSKCGVSTPVLYDQKSRIYILIKDYADIIRNKVLHFQQSVALDLFYTSAHALKYLVNILMEIEKNGYL